SAKPALTLSIATTLYVFVHTWALGWRFDSFHANAFDMGYVDQTLWASTRYGFLHSSLSRGETYLGEHFSPILGLVAFLYRLTGSPYVIFFFQSLILATGAPLVFLLAREKRVEKSLAVLLAICFLLFHPLRAANTFDFREDDLFVPIFLASLLFA